MLFKWSSWNCYIDVEVVNFVNISIKVGRKKIKKIESSLSFFPLFKCIRIEFKSFLEVLSSKSLVKIDEKSSGKVDSDFWKRTIGPYENII